MPTWRAGLTIAAVLAALAAGWFGWPARPADPSAFVAATNLPPEVLQLETLRRELSPTWQSYRFAMKDYETMLAVSKERPRIKVQKPEMPRVVVDDPFYTFVIRRIAPGSDRVLFRKGKNGNMAAVRGPDGQVRLLFDYRFFARAWLSFRTVSDKKLAEEHDGGFFVVEVPDGVNEVQVWTHDPPTHQLLETWKLDSSFANRARLLQ